MDAFYVSGNHGTLTVSAETGEIVSWSLADGDDEYADIARFDVSEWRACYPGARIAGEVLDILDIGFWCGGGEYVPAEEDWRAERIAAREE